ncbi:MAG: 4-hydroxy-tetrahydrodipicolinate reductase [Alphaproteobacteria bacterium]
MSELRIGVIGAAGRMGRMVSQVVIAHEDCALAAALEQPDSAFVGQDVGNLAGLDAAAVWVVDDPDVFFGACDAVIEFTAPHVTLQHAAQAAAAGCVFVTGTTGFDTGQQDELRRTAETIPIVWAPNMSAGVNLLFALTRQVAAALGEDYDVEIVEMHHRDKVDAPSGTALGLGRAAAAGRGLPLEDVQVLSREGHTGARKRGQIGFAALRGGDVVGDHSVIFAADGERLELTHRASRRDNYAKGAVRAALWARGREPGLYGMEDVLGLTV